MNTSFDRMTGFRPVTQYLHTIELSLKRDKRRPAQVGPAPGRRGKRSRPGKGQDAIARPKRARQDKPDTADADNGGIEDDGFLAQGVDKAGNGTVEDVRRLERAMRKVAPDQKQVGALAKARHVLGNEAVLAQLVRGKVRSNFVVQKLLSKTHPTYFGSPPKTIPGLWGLLGLITNTKGSISAAK